MHYRPGRNNGNADSLSRQYSGQAECEEPDQTRSPPAIQHYPEESEVVTQQQIAAFPSQSGAELATLQRTDQTLKVFLVFWREGKPPNKEKRSQLSKEVQRLLTQWDRIVEKGGLLYRRVTAPHGEPYAQLLLPICLRQELLNNLQHGHQGV